MSYCDLNIKNWLVENKPTIYNESIRRIISLLLDRIIRDVMHEHRGRRPGLHG